MKKFKAMRKFLRRALNNFSDLLRHKYETLSIIISGWIDDLRNGDNE